MFCQPLNVLQSGHLKLIYPALTATQLNTTGMCELLRGPIQTSYYLLASNTNLLISIRLQASRHETSDNRVSGGTKESLLIQRSSALRWCLGELSRGHGNIWLPIQCKLISLVTLSGSDKANDLLSSQIDSLICLLYEMKVNDKESFQTLPFKLQPLSCRWKKSPCLKNGLWSRPGMTVLA